MAPPDPTLMREWLAWAQLVFGFACLVVGLRTRGRPGELLAPVGVMGVVAALSHFLTGTLRDEILIPLEVSAFAALTVWFVRGYRASRARTRERLGQRAQSRP